MGSHQYCHFYEEIGGRERGKGILVDGDGDEERAGDGLIRVDGVRTGHGRERCDLDAGAGPADHNGRRPGPLFLEADGGDDLHMLVLRYMDF